jgi:hypothetical protein
MRLVEINHTLLENVEKATPVLEKYICGLIAKPFKRFMAEHGLEYKKLIESLTEDQLSRIQSYSAQIIEPQKENLYSFAILFAINMVSKEVIWASMFQSGELIKRIKEVILNYTRQKFSMVTIQNLINAIDNKKLPPYEIQQVYDCDPIYMRGKAQGLSDEQLKSPFAKAIARWVYDPDIQHDVKLPDDTEFLREQLSIFNKAKAKGLNIDVDSIVSYEQFMQVMEPYQADMDKVDKYALSGFKLVTSYGKYRIWELSWIPDEKDHTLHKVIGDAGWCVKRKSHFDSYLKNGPLYLVTKANKKYALIHFGSEEYKNVQNVCIEDPDAESVLIALLTADSDILREFFAKVSAEKDLVGQASEVLHQRKMSLSGNYAMFNNSAKLLAIATDYFESISTDEVFQLQIAERANTQIEYFKKHNIPKDMVVLAQVNPRLYRHILSTILSKKQAAIRYKSFLKLSQPLEEIESEILSGLGQTPTYLYGLQWYIDTLAANPSPDFNHLLDFWSKCQSLYAPQDRVWASNNPSSLKLVIKNGRSETYEKFKADLLAMSRGPLNILEFILFTGDTKWSDGVNYVKQAITNGASFPAYEKDKIIHFLLSINQADFDNPKDIYYILSRHLSTGDDAYISDEQVDILEKRLADTDIKLAVDYAIKFRGPWPYLEKKLLENLRKGVDNAEELVELYKREVLYGEEYE